MKPTGRCQGSGIFLVNKLAQVTPYRTKSIQQEQPQQQNNQTKQQQIKKNKEKVNDDDSQN